MLHEKESPSRAARSWLVTLAAMTMTGCLTDNRPYPARWGERPVVVGNTCADISGSYSGCEGESGNRMAGGECLGFFWNRSDQFSPGIYSEARDSDVTIEQTADQLHIAYLAYGKTVAQKELLKDKKDGFSCTTEGITVSAGSPFQQNLLGYRPSTYTIIKNSEGRLIVTYRESGGGLLLGVIPAAGSVTIWDRVDPYVAEAAASAEAQAQAEIQRKKAALEARFESTDRGTVIDSATGLEWTQADNGNDINWKQSDEWCSSLGDRWRLTTTAELTGIFDSSGTLNTPCGGNTCMVSSKFHLTGSNYWTSEHEGRERWIGPRAAWSVNLRIGNRESSYERWISDIRALCVRHP
jgi:Protein of unknown function (DUF1566)